jgi:hypothetical protein
MRGSSGTRRSCHAIVFEHWIWEWVVSKAALHKFPAVIALIGCLTACGGGGDGGTTATASAPPAPPTNASPGGVWNGTDAASGLSITGLVTETGEFHFLRSDGIQYFGTMTVTGNAATANFTGVVPAGYQYPDGSLTGTGTLTGTIQARTSISGTASFTTARGAASPSSNLTLSFNPIYNRSSSLSAIAGNYRDPDTNSVINVNSNGVIFAQDAVTGCVINGSAAIVNASYNAYRLEYNFSGCRGSRAYLNGTTARGLGGLDNTTTPERVVIGVVNATAGYSLVGSYPRT